MARFNRPVAVQRVISACNHANYSAVTKPQCTLFRLKHHIHASLQIQLWTQTCSSSHARAQIVAAGHSRICAVQSAIFIIYWRNLVQSSLNCEHREGGEDRTAILAVSKWVSLPWLPSFQLDTNVAFHFTTSDAYAADCRTADCTVSV